MREIYYFVVDNRIFMYALEIMTNTHYTQTMMKNIIHVVYQIKELEAPMS